MNLEDFKSFRRVLKPSEVGSIPTHSRQAWTGVVGALAVLAAPAAAAAQEDVLPHPGPLNRALRSAVVPAWGQVTNGKEVKAAVLVGVQSYIWTRVLMEGRKKGESERTAVRLELSGDLAGQAVAEASAERHSRTRRDLLFWAMFASMYGALDAYIDAHLGDFDRELEEGRELFAGVDPAAGELRLGIRF